MDFEFFVCLIIFNYISKANYNFIVIIYYYQNNYLNFDHFDYFNFDNFDYLDFNYFDLKFTIIHSKYC